MEVFWKLWLEVQSFSEKICLLHFLGHPPLPLAGADQLIYLSTINMCFDCLLVLFITHVHTHTHLVRTHANNVNPPTGAHLVRTHKHNMHPQTNNLTHSTYTHTQNPVHTLFIHTQTHTDYIQI